MGHAALDPPVVPFSPAELQAARVLMRARGCRLIEALAQAHDGPDAACVARLAVTVRMKVAGIEAMHEMTPAFDLLAYGEALQRECLLFRAGTDG